MPALHLLLQTYLTLLGSTVLIPFICVPPMGGSPTGEENSAAITTDVRTSTTTC
jgi:hypothetical protein